MIGQPTERDPPGSGSLLGIFSSIGGRVLSHYEVGTVIGKGGMGHVYDGHDIRLNRRVAIKVLPHWARGDPHARKRFLKEARAAAAVNHPHIVTVYEIGQHQGVDLMVMEYLHGKTLDKAVPRRGLPPLKAVSLALQIGDALSTAHAAGILHRDLKPSNIMITEAGRAKLLDFGLAERSGVKTRRTRGSDKPRQPGTRVYMSPEQLRGRPGDVRSEIFSFGLVLHQMLSGKHPFQADTPAIVMASIKAKSAAALPPKVPRHVAQVVERCLSRTPRQRFQSMPEVLDALGKAKTDTVPISSARKPERSGLEKKIKFLIRRVAYDNVSQSCRALTDIANLMRAGAPAATRTAVASHMKDQILKLDDYGGNGVPDSVREIRKTVLDVMKEATRGDLAQLFQHRQLEFLDLFGMNFADCRLAGISFRRCFLVEATFRNSQLAGACFARACIRNVDFAGADLSAVDFTDADWFNATNLSESQLASAQRETLRECPPNEQGMRAHLNSRYGYSFDSWPIEVQDQLKSTWREYLRPGGLRDLVARWRLSSE